MFVPLTTALPTLTASRSEPLLERSKFNVAPLIVNAVPAAPKLDCC